MMGKKVRECNFLLSPVATIVELTCSLHVRPSFSFPFHFQLREMVATGLNKKLHSLTFFPIIGLTCSLHVRPSFSLSFYFQLRKMDATANENGKFEEYEEKEEKKVRE